MEDRIVVEHTVPRKKRRQNQHPGSTCSEIPVKPVVEILLRAVSDGNPEDCRLTIMLSNIGIEAHTHIDLRIGTLPECEYCKGLVNIA